jgi:hypothetical protein
VRGERRGVIRRHGQDACVLEGQRCLPTAGAVDLQPQVHFALETLDQHQVARCELRQQFRQRWLRCATILVQQRPALDGCDQHLLRARLAMQVTVLARKIEIEGMMRVLDRRHAQSASRCELHQSRDQVRLAGVLATHDAEDFHAALPLKRS